MPDPSLESRIAEYLTLRMPDAGDIAVSGLARIHGGISQETFRFHASWREASETGRLRKLLVELHEHVDRREDGEAKRIGQAIWRALRAIEMPRAARA